MLLLDRKTPKSILLHEALLRRLDPNDKDFSYFQDSFTRLKVGHEGEFRVDREWFEMPYLNEHFLLFNYEIENEFGFSHQIDTLLLTKHFLLVLEVKNIVGRIDYEEHKHQFIRTKLNGSEDILTNPIDQLRRHEELLERLLLKMKYSLPIEKAVVMANPSTVIGNVPKSPPIFHASGLRTFVKRCLMRHPSVLTTNQLEKLAKYFLSKVVSRKVHLNISTERIRKGVLCEECSFKVVMTYHQGFWHCPKCGHRSKRALLIALNDYRLLISDKITNREFRDFFNVESLFAASKILTRLNLEARGNNRGRFYIIPEDILN